MIRPAGAEINEIFAPRAKPVKVKALYRVGRLEVGERLQAGRSLGADVDFAAGPHGAELFESLLGRPHVVEAERSELLDSRELLQAGVGDAGAAQVEFASVITVVPPAMRACAILSDAGE
jgi:hypothetical protein